MNIHVSFTVEVEDDEYMRQLAGAKKPSEIRAFIKYEAEGQLCDYLEANGVTVNGGCQD